MARLIDADELIDEWNTKIKQMHKDSDGAYPVDFALVISALSKAPTVDAVPVVHGRWVTDEKGVTYCRRCRIIDDYASVHNYCPNCGATMDLEVKDA